MLLRNKRLFTLIKRQYQFRPYSYLYSVSDDYNQNSDLQASCIPISIKKIKQALSKEEFTFDTGTINIADYGCAGGKNSIEPLKAAMQVIKSKNPSYQFSITANDLPINNFNITLRTLQDKFDKDVFVFGAGRNFYEQVCPSNSIHFGYSNFAAHYLNTPFPAHFYKGPSLPQDTKDAELLQKWKERAAADWKRFLEMRQEELVPGGKLLIVAGGQPGEYEPIGIVSSFGKTITEFYEKGIITQQEYDSIIIPQYYRTIEEITAPLKNLNIQVDYSAPPEIIKIECPFYTAFKEDLRKYASAITQCYKAIANQFLLSVLRRYRNDENEVQNVANQVWKKYEENAFNYPEQCSSTMHVFFLMLQKPK